ncbi:hypothetical protein GCM10023192_61240 [Amycolatopsis samaneae]
MFTRLVAHLVDQAEQFPATIVLGDPSQYDGDIGGTPPSAQPPAPSAVEHAKIAEKSMHQQQFDLFEVLVLATILRQPPGETEKARGMRGSHEPLFHQPSRFAAPEPT